MAASPWDEGAGGLAFDDDAWGRSSDIWARIAEPVAAYVTIDAKTPISVAGGIASAGDLYLMISLQIVRPSTK